MTDGPWKNPALPEWQRRCIHHQIELHAVSIGPMADVNYCDMIAVCHGWRPLQLDETMTVHMAGKAYRITRTE